MHKDYILTRLWVALAAAVVLLPPCFAVDGVIEINQASVMASGGFPFVIEEPGSYRLMGDLVVEESSTPGIFVGEIPGVTIDLNGFSIIGLAEPKAKAAVGDVRAMKSRAKGITINSSVGILSIGPATILNGKITGFLDGIALFASGNHIKKVRIFGNGTGVFIDAPSGGLVENCEILGNFFGFFGFGVVVRDSAISENAEGGLACFGCTISDNTVANNGVFGIFCVDFDKGKFPEGSQFGCTISNNQVRGNGGIGIGAQASLVTGNTIIAGDGYALELDDFSGWSNNVIQDSNLGALTPAKGASGSTFPQIGGWIIDCNLVNTERFCWDSHLDID